MDRSALVLPLPQGPPPVLQDRLLQSPQLDLPVPQDRVNLLNRQLRTVRLDLRTQPPRLTTMRLGSNPV